jgi:hypothetical protein
MGNLPTSKFDLELENEYIVYGISWWNGVVYYLLIGEGKYPHWYPSELFTVSQNAIPGNWFFTTFGDSEKNGLQAILSYNEMVNNLDEHYDSLMEYEPEATKIFFARVDEINSFQAN